MATNTVLTTGFRCIASMNQLPALLLFGMLLAGCATHGTTKPGPPALTPSTAPSANPTSTGPNLPPRESRGGSASIELTDCHGFDTGFDAPYNMIPSHVPQGWQTYNDTTDLQLEAFQCNRVSIGSFERGPIYYAMEWHNNAIAPQNCQPGAYTRMRVLVGLWISDQEVASYLNATMGMPSQYAQFESQNQTGTGVTDWTFGPPGMTPSEFKVQDLPQQNSGIAGDQYRLVWPNNLGGVSYLDWIERFANDNIANPGIVGNWRAPLLYTNLGVDAFASTVDLDTGDGSGTFSQFQDLKCDTQA